MTDVHPESDLNEKPFQPDVGVFDGDPDYMEEGDDFDRVWQEGDTPEVGTES